MRLLPARRRWAMHVLYAYCRVLDDLADDLPPAEGAAGLAAWRALVHRLPQVDADAPPLARALAPVMTAYDLPRQELEALLDGMVMDVAGPVVAPDRETLRLYCRRVAGSVGVLSVRIFGVPGTRADAFAEALGEALQLTNILRDVAEDGARGRVYLPAPLLQAHGVTDRSPAATLAHPALGAVRAALAAEAEAAYARACHLLPAGDRRRLRPALAMLVVYRHVLRTMAARGWSDLTPPPRPGPGPRLAALVAGVTGYVR